MTRVKLSLLAALIGASTAVLAADPQSDAARQQRMDDALQNYRGGTHANSTQPTSSAGGTFERAENSVKHGAHKTGAAIEHGTTKAGAAIDSGVDKTGNVVSKGMNKGFDAIRHTGEAIQEKTGTTATK